MDYGHTVYLEMVWTYKKDGETNLARCTNKATGGTKRSWKQQEEMRRIAEKKSEMGRPVLDRKKRGETWRKSTWDISISIHVLSLIRVDGAKY